MFEGEGVTKNLALGFGITLLAVGALGFVPAFTPGGNLFGIFAVDAEHNVVHLASGAAAVMAGLSSYRAARMFFQVFGVIYGLVAVLGFAMHPHARGSEELLGFMTINMADNLLHVGIAAFSLFAGFAPRHGQPMTVRHVR
jgi:hypothetical protein